MSFPAYPEYKESGIPWLGNVPSHWSVVQIRRLFRLINGATPSSGYDEYWDGAITWVTPEDLSKTETNQISSSKRTLSEQGYRACGVQLLSAGSLVVSIRAPVGYVAVASVPLCTNQGCRGLQPSRAVDSRFYMYWILACREVLQSLSGGSTFQELSSSAFAAVPTVWPTADEQEKIASFLDYETRRIDALIEEQQRLIELLKEKRQAVISHAVTKGLDPDVPMKESGVEWLGYIPAHWDVTRLPWLTVDQNAGEVIDRGYWGSGEELLYTCAMEPLWCDYEGFPDDKRTGPNDLLLTRNGTPYIHEPHNGAIYTNVVQRVRFPESVNRRFVKRALEAASESLIGHGVSIQSLNYQMWKALYIPFPPAETQGDIIDAIGESEKELDALGNEAEELIKTLRERRHALISAAVTGKIDVRNFTPPEGGEDDCC